MLSGRFSLVIVILFTFCTLLCGQSAKQIELLKKYADRGSAACSYRLAEYAKAGKLSKDTRQNQKEYTKYFNKALSAGYPKAKLEQAVSYLTGRNIRNQHLAYPVLNALLETPISRDFTQKDLFETYYWIGYCQENGKGCSIDSMSAYFCYNLASIDNTKARFALLWRMGKDKDKTVPLDYLYRIYVDDDSPETVRNIRSFLVHFDLASHFSAYLERKAKAGDRKASRLLAENEWSGDLFPLNYSKSLKHYETAADLGDAEAALKLAEVYSKTDLVYIKNGRKINIYTNMYNLPFNLQKAELYAKKALFNKETEKDAALILIQLTKNKLARFTKPPVGMSAEEPEISKSGPPLPPVPGQVIPAGRLNRMAEDPSMVYRRLRNELFYYLMITEDYPAARKILEQDGGGTFHAKNIYLKAKEFRKSQVIMSPAARKHYNDRIRMAANAGYPLAIYEYYLDPEFTKERPSINYSKLIEAALRMPFPELSQWHWNVGSWFLKNGPDKNIPQGLACIRKAAEMGNLDALEFLMKLYQTGDRTLNITANKKVAEKYRHLLLKHDTQLVKEAVFVEYFKNILSQPKQDKNDFSILFRAIGRSPLADLQYAQLLVKGNKTWGVKQNPEHALNMLHYAVRGNVKNKALDAIEKLYPRVIGNTHINRLMHYEQKMLPVYRTLR